VAVHRDKFHTINNALISYNKQCTNFSNLFLKWSSTCFRQFLCPSSEVFHCTHSNGICHTGLLTVCEQDQHVPSWSCLQAVSKPVWLIPLLCVQWKTPDDGQRNCLKHVEFHSKNKFEKLVHLVGFIVRKVQRKFIHTYIHIYIPWLHKCVIKVIGCGTSHKNTYTNQIYCVKCYKHFTKLL